MNWSTWHEPGTKKIWVPSRNRTHDFLSTCWALYPLSYENSWRARSFNVSLLMVSLTLLILAERRTPVTYMYERSEMTLFSMRSHSSVDSAPAVCTGGHGFISCQGLRFFCPTLVSFWLIHLSQVKLLCFYFYQARLSLYAFLPSRQGNHHSWQ